MTYGAAAFVVPRVAVGVLVAFQLQAVFSSASIHRITSEVKNRDRFISLARTAISTGFLSLAIALSLGVLTQSTRTLSDEAGNWSRRAQW